MATGEEQKPTKKEKDLTKQYAGLHEIALSRLSIGRKFGEKYRKNVRKWLKDYNIDSLDEIDREDLHNLLQIPYIFSSVEAQLPSMFETIPQLVFSQRGKMDRDFTDFGNNVWQYVADVVNLEEKVEQSGFMFLVGGMAQTKYGWRMETEPVEMEDEVPLMEEGVEVGTQTVKKTVQVPVKDQPFIKDVAFDRIYFSPDSKFVTQDDEDIIPWIICEEPMSEDRAEYQYNTKVEGAELMDMNDMGIADDEREKLKGVVQRDLKRVHTFEYYGTLPKKESKDPMWSPFKNYYFAFTKKQILSKPEVVSKKPVELIGNYGDTVNFFRFGEPKVLRELEQDISFGRSTIADYRDRIGTKIFVDTTAEFDEFNLKSPRKFAVVRYTGQNPPQYMKPPSIPEAVMTALAMSKEDAQMASGQFAQSGGTTQSILETATGQKIIESGKEKRTNFKRKKIARYLQHLAKNLLVLCAENWDIEKFAQITDLSPEEIQQKGFIEKMQNLDDMYDIEIDIESVTMNEATKSAQAIALYREFKDNQYVNQEEAIRFALETGFKEKDYERFFSKNMSPEQMMRALEGFVQMGMIPPEIGQQMAMAIQQQAQGGEPGAGGDVGRPATQDPTAIVEKSAPGADETQINSQNAAAFKQTGVSKGAQNVR